MTPTWDQLAAKLRPHGIDTDAVSETDRETLLGDFDADCGYDLENPTDENFWPDYADAVAELSERYESPARRRLRTAETLIDSWGQPLSDQPDELAANRYAIVSWSGGRSLVRGAGETLEDVARTYAAIRFDKGEDIDFVRDLDTGKDVARDHDFSSTITVRVQGVRRWG